MREPLSPVALVRVDGGYPVEAPFHPGEAYPEYAARPLAPGPNPVYGAVRNLFARLGLDRERFGTRDWNPLGGIVRPGDRVFVKPNLVTHEHRASCGRGGDLFSVITHPSVVRAVADYAAIALEGRGEIVIGDNPSIDADFDRILRATRLDAVGAIYGRHFGVICRVLDLRPLRTDDLGGYGFRGCTTRQAGDPEGASLVNLGSFSRFCGLDPSRLRGVFTDRAETIRHHSGDCQEYSISNTILNADAFISVPKLKAHHKVGATLNVKGLVGINSNKNLLPHWQQGFGGHGGDEFPRSHRALDPWRLAVVHLLEDVLPERLLLRGPRLVPRALRRAFERRTISSHERYRGAWDGNDTCWRMAADLYEVFVQDRGGWRRRNGKSPQRFFSVIDGVTAGEGDGPFCPTARSAGVLLGGRDLLLADAVAARFMDFDIGEIRYLRDLLDQAGVDLQRVPIATDLPGFDRAFRSSAHFGRFRAPNGWPRLSTVAAEEAAA